jgi:hypothetical protein
MTLYQNPSFTLPTTTVNMSKMLYEYRVGMITAEEYQRITGHKPDEDEHDRTST